MVSLLYQINAQIENMGRAECRVARFVTGDPSSAINMSMAVLAEASEVSDPTIVRFFRRFGFDGFTEFKLKLAQDLVPLAPFEYEAIHRNDRARDVVRKTCNNSINAIQRSLLDLNVGEIERATAALLEAQWISILATGMSEMAALDAEHKFTRLGRRCSSVVRASHQVALGKNVHPGDLLLVFSQSGATKRLVIVADEARRNGAVTVAVTAPNSPLARVVTHLIGVNPYERMEMMTPLASRLSHQLLVNMLVTTMSIASGSEFPDQLSALDSWVTDKV